VLREHDDGDVPARGGHGVLRRERLDLERGHGRNEHRDQQGRAETKQIVCAGPGMPGSSYDVTTLARSHVTGWLPRTWRANATMVATRITQPRCGRDPNRPAPRMPGDSQPAQAAI